MPISNQEKITKNDEMEEQNENDVKIPKTVERIWRVLIKHGNVPMTTRELAKELEVTPNAVVQAINRYPQYFHVKSRKPLLIELPTSKEAIAFREDNRCLVCKKIEMNPSEGEIFPLSGKQDSQKFNDWQFICAECTQNLRKMKFSEYIMTFPSEHREEVLKEIERRRMKGGIQQLVKDVQVFGKKVREDLKKVTIYRQVIVRKSVSVDEQFRLRIHHQVEQLHDVSWLRRFLQPFYRNEIPIEKDPSFEKDLEDFLKAVHHEKFLSMQGGNFVDILDAITNHSNWRVIQIQSVNSTRHILLCAMEIATSLQDLILGLTPYFINEDNNAGQTKRGKSKNYSIQSNFEETEDLESNDLNQLFNDLKLESKP